MKRKWRENQEMERDSLIFEVMTHRHSHPPHIVQSTHRVKTNISSEMFHSSRKFSSPRFFKHLKGASFYAIAKTIVCFVLKYMGTVANI